MPISSLRHAFSDTVADVDGLLVRSARRLGQNTATMSPGSRRGFVEPSSNPSSQQQSPLAAAGVRTATGSKVCQPQQEQNSATPSGTSCNDAAADGGDSGGGASVPWPGYGMWVATNAAAAMAASSSSGGPIPIAQVFKSRRRRSKMAASALASAPIGGAVLELNDPYRTPNATAVVSVTGSTALVRSSAASGTAVSAASAGLQSPTGGVNAAEMSGNGMERKDQQPEQLCIVDCCCCCSGRLLLMWLQGRYRSAFRSSAAATGTEGPQSSTVQGGPSSSAETSPFHRPPIHSRPSLATTSVGVGAVAGAGGGSLAGSFGSTPWAGGGPVAVGRGSAATLTDSAAAWILPPQLPQYDDRAMTAAASDADDRGSLSGCSEQLGRIQFHLSYDFQTLTLNLRIINATNLAAKDISGTSDPYVKVMLLPDKKRKMTTNIKRKNLNPRWNEQFAFEGFPFTKLQTRTLYLQVMDYDRFCRDDPIGEVCLPLSDVDLIRGQTFFKTLQPCVGHTGKLGEILLSVCYQPTAEILSIVIIEARQLKSKDINGLSDPYVKIWLMVDGKKVEKRKTSVSEKTLNPKFNELFMFRFPYERVRQSSLVVSVMDHDRFGRNELIGKVVLGAKSGPIEVKHWNEMFAKTRQPVAHWHILRDFR